MERPHSITMAFFGDGLLKEEKNVVENGFSTMLNLGIMYVYVVG